MKHRKSIFILLFIFWFINTEAQEGFRFLNQKKKKVSVKFKLINNLIVIPLNINDKKVSFILDSGVTKTILFNITKNDSLGLNNLEKIKLQGLGKGDAVEALMSKNNKISVNNIQSNDESVYVILRDYFDLSGKMGITIHGILGYDLLKNFIVKINYKTKYIHFYNPKKAKLKTCRNCEVFPLTFHRKKPYINTDIKLDTIGNKFTNVKLLIDTGGSDALWLFENSKYNIQTPNRFFTDILGEGLSGTIYGKRSRISAVQLGNYIVKEPTVSFLDSVSTKNARSVKDRNGSIGAGILKRFIIWFDYANQKLMLKKNGSLTNGFDYNMSGLDVIYSGKQLVKERQTIVSNPISKGSENSKTINFISSFSYKFKPSFKIRNVVKGSPSHVAGLQKGDIILKLNNANAADLTLESINQKFQERDNKRIRITVLRNEQKMKFEFFLEKKI